MLRRRNVVAFLILSSVLLVSAALAKDDKKCKADPNGNASGYLKECGTATSTIGFEGGTLQTGLGATVSIPFGALDRPTTITIETMSSPAPPRVGAISHIYRFGPEGTVFVKPLTISLPLPAGVTRASMYWSKFGSTTEFEPIGGTIANETITAQTSHFSLAVIGDYSPVRTVTGLGHETWISATTRTSVPRDFAAVPAEAILYDVAGNLVTIPAVPGTGAALGTFTIAGMPTGEYILRSSNQYLVTSSISPDLGFSSGGRPDAMPIDPARGAFIRFSLGNLAPWQVGDTLELFATEVDDWHFGTEQSIPDPDRPRPGQPFLNFTFDMMSLNGTATPKMIQGRDRLHFAQLSVRTSTTGVRYQAMSRLIQFPPFDLIEGGTVSVGGVMFNVETAHAISADYHGADYRQLLVRDGNPAQRFDCGACRSLFGVLAQPGTAAEGFYSSNADLLLVPDAAGANYLTGVLFYGSPYAGLVGNWGLIGLVFANGRVFYTLPGTLRSNIGLDSFFEWTADPAALALPTVLAPPLSLPRNIRVDGQPAFSDQVLTSTTPLITWEPPATGTPTHYKITIRRLIVSGGRTVIQQGNVANIITPNTSFRLLSGTLAPTNHYVFIVSAVKAAGMADAPFRAVLDSVRTATPTAIMTTP